MKYKAIFSDFDGTLYSNNFCVSKENIDAIHAYENIGGLFFISTGRLFQSIYPHLIKLGTKAKEVIVAQGAGIFDIDSKKPIYQKMMAKPLIKKISDFMLNQIKKRPNISALMYVDDNCYFINNNRSQIDMFCDLLKVEPTIIESNLYDYIEKTNSLPTKVLAIMDKSQIDDFISEGKNELGQEVVFCESRDFLVEIMPFGVNKGDSVTRIAKKYGIILDDIICIGDSDNDISMIDVAGLGVAVGDAFDRVKNHAQYVSTSCDNNAIADVINKFCLGENDAKF